MRAVISLAALSVALLALGGSAGAGGMETRPPARRGLLVLLEERWTLGQIQRQVGRLARGAQRPVVIFDLDNTLFDPTLRATRILRHIGRRNDVAVLKQLTYRGENAADLYRLVGQEVKDPGKLGSMGRAFARLYDRLGSSGTLDRLAPGGVGYVQALHQAGATVVYLTGRSERHAGRTTRTLRAVGLPTEGGRVSLIMRPESTHDVVEFKRSRLDALARMGRVVAAFDDDPANCELFRQRFPRARSVFVQMHDVRKPLARGVLRIRDFAASPGGPLRLLSFALR